MSPGCLGSSGITGGLKEMGPYSHAALGMAAHGATERHSESGVQEGRDGAHTSGEALTNG